MATALKDQERIHELTEKEAADFFSAAVRARLNITTEEFLANLRAGKYQGREEDPRIMKLITIAPFMCG